MIKIRYNFQQIHELTNKLNLQMDDSFYMPDQIVGLSRGGLVPAVILSHQFNKPMTSLNFSTRDFAFIDELTCKSILHRIHDGEKVVIVDDICDSGLTFTSLISTWTKIDPDFTREKYKKTLKFASLFMAAKCKFHLDYFGELSHQWIVFPWEE
jgi:hypoxanthine phosphoribosyltransferase